MSIDANVAAGLSAIFRLSQKAFGHQMATVARRA